MGKAVGGTLGQPLEGTDGPYDLTFYDPVPTQSIPNDDLDLQVLWACKLAEMEKPVVSRKLFEDGWLNNIGFPCDEYGIAIRNLKRGIVSPWSGSIDNYWTDGLGAAIRSELWAFLAPGDPALAVKYAALDGEVDHAGNGVYAQLLMTAMESAAFTESDFGKLIEIGLSFIPADCELAVAVRTTAEWTKTVKDFTTIRNMILDKFGNDNFTDVKMNFAFMTAALLLGDGDFDKTVCMAVNFGRDADCTGATVGSIMGLVNPDCIPERWLKPIGLDLIISDTITGITPPETLDAFTDLVAELKDKVTLDESPAPAKPDCSKLAIRFKTSLYAPWFGQDDNRFKPVMTGDVSEFTAPGMMFTVPEAMMPNDTLRLLETTFKLEKKEKVRIMVNTRANVRVWVDDVYRFGREAHGRMAPSFHRAPLNQFCDLELEAGAHTLRIGLALDGKRSDALVAMGIGTVKDMQWLPFAFED